MTPSALAVSPVKCWPTGNAQFLLQKRRSHILIQDSDSYARLLGFNFRQIKIGSSQSRPHSYLESLQGETLVPFRMCLSRRGEKKLLYHANVDDLDSFFVLYERKSVSQSQLGHPEETDQLHLLYLRSCLGSKTIAQEPGGCGKECRGKFCCRQPGQIKVLSRHLAAFRNLITTKVCPEPQSPGLSCASFHVRHTCPRTFAPPFSDTQSPAWFSPGMTSQLIYWLWPWHGLPWEMHEIQTRHLVLCALLRSQLSQSPAMAKSLGCPGSCVLSSRSD